MPDEPLTDLEQSRADHGQVFLRLKTGYANGFCTSMNAKKGKPTGEGTKGYTALEVPDAEDMRLDISGDYRLCAYPTRIWEESDDDDFFDHPNIVEITHDEYYAILP